MESVHLLVIGLMRSVLRFDFLLAPVSVRGNLLFLYFLSLLFLDHIHVEPVCFLLRLCALNCIRRYRIGSISYVWLLLWRSRNVLDQIPS